MLTPASNPSILLSSGSPYSRYCSYYNWTATTTGVLTLSFSFLNQPDVWYLDEVSVRLNGTELLNNTGFNTSVISPWIVTVSNTTCTSLLYKMCSSNNCYISPCFCSSSAGCITTISQQFPVMAGQVYTTKFWLSTRASGSDVSVNVTQT